MRDGSLLPGAERPTVRRTLGSRQGGGPSAAKLVTGGGECIDPRIARQGTSLPENPRDCPHVYQRVPALSPTAITRLVPPRICDGFLGRSLRDPDVAARPSLVAVASLSIGLGVGATTTMYSVVNRVAHYDLGFTDVNRLAVLSSTDTARGINEQPPTFEIAQALVDRGTSFESFGLFQGGGAPVTLTGPSGASRVERDAGRRHAGGVGAGASRHPDRPAAGAAIALRPARSSARESRASSCAHPFPA